MMVIFIGAIFSPAKVRIQAILAVGAFFVGPLLFTNLYYRHDYYYVANAMLLLFGAGLVLTAVWDTKRLALSAKLLLISLFFAAQLYAFYRGYSYNYRRELPKPPGISKVVSATTSPDDIVVVYGWDWNALVPYYAQRRVVMIPQGRDYDLPVLEEVISQIPDEKITGMLIRTSATPASPEFIANRVARFKLADTPIATSNDGDFYIREDLFTDAFSRLKTLTLKDVSINTEHKPAIETFELNPTNPSELDLPFLNPSPLRSLSQFGLKATELDGTAILFAHPRVHLFFPLPPENTRIVIKLGITANAYASTETPSTDGIQMTITHLAENGDRSPLLIRNINPAQNPRDRGIQTIVIENISGLKGELEIYLSPGLMGNLTNDWAYISEVTID